MQETSRMAFSMLCQHGESIFTSRASVNIYQGNSHVHISAKFAEDICTFMLTKLE